MRRPLTRALAAAALAAAPGATATSGGDWPQWRGPAHTGESPERDLPVRWTATENVRWKLPLPGGSGSTPIVSGGQVFLNVAEGPEVALWCLERTTGRVSWKRPLGPSEGHAHRKHNMSTPSPVVGDGRVFAMTGNGVVKGFTLDGKELWARDLQKDYSPTPSSRKTRVSSPIKREVPGPLV